MRRTSLSILCIAVTLALGGCVGDTDPATKIGLRSAQLNAHGYTNDGPATWWWEYDTVRADIGTIYDTEVCGNGTGPKEPDARCGPASGGSQQNQIPLNVVLTGLRPDETYYFRACGQDVPNPPSENEPATCGRILGFTTLAATRYAFERKWGGFGTANGQFKNPSGVATDSAGNVYVADSGNHRIQKFGSSGNFIAKWGRNGGDGSSGSGDGQFNSPSGVHPNYVADTGNNRIQRFSASGAFLGKWGSPGSGDGQFNQPRGIAFTFDFGEVYVADTNNNRIQAFGATGSFLGKWGSLGSGDGQFNQPSGVAFGAGGVYVADTNNNRIQHTLGPVSSGEFVRKWGSLGTANGQFNQPRGVAFDPFVYVADTNNHRIQQFTSLGDWVGKWGRNGGDGSSGSGDGQFNQPRGVAVDPDGNIYVADSGNHRIQKFKPTQ